MIAVVTACRTSSCFHRDAVDLTLRQDVVLGERGDATRELEEAGTSRILPPEDDGRLRNIFSPLAQKSIDHGWLKWSLRIHGPP